jgi:hypothetical protein
VAKIDVSFLLSDPDFLDDAVLITRSQVVGDDGFASFTETSKNIVCCVQPLPFSALEKFGDYALVTDGIEVYYRGKLYAESPNGYSNIIEWNGARYQVKEVVEDFMTYGAGWSKAICIAEAVNAK